MRHEMFFGVWDKNKKLIFGKVLESLEGAEELAEEWWNDRRTNFVGVNWRKARRRAGFQRNNVTQNREQKTT